MADWDIQPSDDWLRRFFSGIPFLSSTGGIAGRLNDMPRQFDEMRREMERMFEEQFRDIETKVPKELLREYQTFRLGSTGTMAEPLIRSEREPLADVVTSDKEVKVVIEVPGINKENIRINAYDNSLEVTTNDPQRKYHRVIELPPEADIADIETVKSTYKNGILEIVFRKKEQSKPKGKEIKVE